ncbi:hypothetical protein ACVOMV_22665 [Mesorhizobium atlanticum]
MRDGFRGLCRGPMPSAAPLWWHHRAGLERIMQAGAVPVSWVQFACELQRDWLREKTVPGFAEIVFAVEGH